MDQAAVEAVYMFICRFIEAQGYSPTMREIGRGCFMSHSNVYRYLDRLEQQGRIERDPGQARSIRLVERRRRD